MANVKEVEWQGGIYNIADEVARGEAQQARALVDTAQVTAERALTAAGNAQNAAGAAQDSADDAQITADAAQNTANATQSAVTALAGRVGNIEAVLGDHTFQIPTTGGLIPEPGYNVGVKSGNVVSITVGVRPQPLSAGHIIAILPEGTRPKIGTILCSITRTWTTGSHVEITTTGDITLREPTSDGVYLSATFVC